MITFRAKVCIPYESQGQLKDIQDILSKNAYDPCNAGKKGFHITATKAEEALFMFKL